MIMILLDEFRFFRFSRKKVVLTFLNQQASWCVHAPTTTGVFQPLHGRGAPESFKSARPPGGENPQVLLEEEDAESRG